MAKNKIEIDVKVDDKGTTKKVGVEAKKAAKGLDGLGKGARTADRNLKGAAQASSNGTKNFSKMSQGVGGLVGVYATLAAQAFALSAAFEFMKKVGDLRVLKDSQVAYASTTGIAIRSLSTEIRAAADGMLTFEEASKSAAIGISSGLGQGQLLNLAKGAAAVSKVLGRDVSDSYDRLVRGVTKAEPELLDELGITLRLEDAKSKYAISIGKTVKALTLMEAKQAVAVEVQSQLDTKFISTTDSIDIQANAMKKFGVAFNDLFVSVADFLAGPIEAAAKFFAGNMKSLVAVVALFALTIVKSMLPSLDSFEAKAVAAADSSAQAFERASASYQKMKNATGPTAQIAGALSDVDAPKGSGVDRLKNSQSINKRQAAALLKYAKLEQGVYTRLTNHQKSVYTKALKDILGQKETFWERAKRGWYGLGNVMSQVARKAQVVWRKTMSKITSYGVKAGRAIAGAFSILGKLAIGQMLVDLAESGLKAIGIIGAIPVALVEFGESVAANRESLVSLIAEYAKLHDAMDSHLNKANEGNDIMKPTITSYKTLGNAIKTSATAMADYIDLLSLRRQLQSEYDSQTGFVGLTYVPDGSTEIDENLEKASESAKILAQRLLPTILRFQELGFAANSEPLKLFVRNLVDMSNGSIGLSMTAKQLMEVANEFEMLTTTATTFEESFNSSNLAFDKFLQGITKYKTSATDLINDTMKEIEAVTTKFGSLGQALTQTLAFKKQKEELIERLAFLSLIDDKETKSKLSQIKLDRKSKAHMHGMTQLVKDKMEREKKVLDMQIRYEDSLSEQASLMKEGLTLDDEKLQIVHQQTAALLDQVKMLEEANGSLYRLGQVAAQAFEDGFQSGLADLIKGKETSFKDTMLALAVSVGDAIADELATQMTESVMSFLNIKKKKTAHELMQESMVQAAKEAKTLWDKSFDDAAKKFEDAMNKPIDAKLPKEIRTSGQYLPSPSQIQKDIAATIERDKKIAAEAERLASGLKPIPTGTRDDPIFVVPIGGSTTPLLETPSVLPPGHSGPRNDSAPSSDDKFGPLIPIATQKNTAIQKDQLEMGYDNVAAIGNSISSMDTLTGELVPGGGFDRMLTGSFGTFTKNMGMMLASSLGGGSTAGQIAGMALSAVIGNYSGTARNGGVFSEGRKLQGYATGGIAKGSTSGYPVMMHGTEAIVPLPQGGGIPVDMKGAGATQNNIVVNVSTEGKTDTKGSTGPDMDKMGSAIAVAVQAELQNQKRSGGILNPYGVA